jgi:hypothetical protein
MKHAIRSEPARSRLGRPYIVIGAALLAALAAAAPASAAAKTPAATVTAQTTWGTPSPEFVTADAAAPGGGFYETGTTNLADSLGDPLDLDELFLIKVAADGSLVWQKNYAASAIGIYNANDMAVAADGSIYVTGLFAPDGDQAGDIMLLKFASDGSLDWQRTWDNNGNSEDGESVAIAGDGSIYVTGGSDPLEEVGPLVLLRYTPDGDLTWQKTWTDTAPGTAGASGQAVAVGSDGNIHVGGTVFRNDGSFDVDLVVLTVNPSGTLVWQRDMAAGDDADARGGMAVGSDGSVYAVGGLLTGSGTNNTLIAKFSSSGSLTWGREYDGVSGDDNLPGGLVVQSGGNLLIGGSTQSPFVGGPMFDTLLTVNSSGSGLSCTSFDGPGFDEGDGVALAADGTVALAGITSTVPPLTVGTCSSSTRSLKSKLTTPSIPLLTATGTVRTPAGTVTTATGTSPGPGAGGFDAALIQVTP